MFSTVRRGASTATLIQLGAELSWILAAVMLAVALHGSNESEARMMLVPAAAFAVLMVMLNGAFGLYRLDQRLDFATYVSRLFLAMLIAVPIAYLTVALLPGGGEFRSTLPVAVMLAFCGLILVRHAVVGPLLTTFLPRRILVMGTGHEARLVESSIASLCSPRIRLVGFFPLERLPELLVSSNYLVAPAKSLEETVRVLRIHEIIVAVGQQRGGVLPLRSMLECRLSGVQITDLAKFFEVVHGRVPVESLKASWLIYGNGFRQNWLRVLIKRAFDIVVACILLVCMLPIIAVTAFMIALESGFPIIYRQERVGLRGKVFEVLKFRSMRKDAEQDGKPRWAVVGDSRVTALGRFLRRSRIDELPQLLNVLKGEMSFVGPRPERQAFVDMLSKDVPFYSVRHSVKPGITGWAQVRYSYGANMEESVRKLEYDLYYVKNHSFFLDLLILMETVRVVIMGEGAR